MAIAHALDRPGDYTCHVMVDYTCITIAACKYKSFPSGLSKVYFIKFNLSLLSKQRKQTQTHTHARTQSCLIKLGKQSSSGRKVSQGCTVSAIYKLLPQISQVPCEGSWETCHWKCLEVSYPASCFEKRETHNLDVLFCCFHDDNITLASCPQLPPKQNDVRWCSSFACIKLMFWVQFWDRKFQFLILF